MKKLVLLAIAGIAASVWATAPASNTVSTTSVVLVPKKPVSYTSWTTNTAYAQGVVVKSGSLYYMTTDGGRTTNAAPTHTSGEQVATGGGISWRQVSQHARNGVVISVQTTSADGGQINLSLGGSDAVANQGLTLVGQGASLIFSLDDSYQGAIEAISTTGSNVVVGVQEF